MTSLETARSLSNGPSWGGGGAEGEVIATSPISLLSMGGVCGRSLSAGKILFTGRQTCSLYLVLLCDSSSATLDVGGSACARSPTRSALLLCLTAIHYNTSSQYIIPIHYNTSFQTLHYNTLQCIIPIHHSNTLQYIPLHHSNTLQYVIPIHYSDTLQYIIPNTSLQYITMHYPNTSFQYITIHHYNSYFITIHYNALSQ